MPFDPTRIPDDIVTSFKEGKCSIFIGAGLSISSGLPSWKGLLEELIAEVVKLPYDTTTHVEEYNKLINDPAKYLLIAQDIKNTLGKLYFDLLQKIFTNPTLKPSPNHKLIADLPSKFIITTNYDNLIEKAYVVKLSDIPVTLTFTQSKEIAYKLWNKEFFILKAHGDARINKNEVIMTERDYRDILFNSAGFQSALQVMFSTSTILFIGSSFSDPDFILLMRYLHTAYHGGGPTHYILMNENDILDVEARRYMEDFNLHTIRYNPENNYEQITQFLELLNAGVAAP